MESPLSLEIALETSHVRHAPPDSPAAVVSGWRMAAAIRLTDPGLSVTDLDPRTYPPPAQWGLGRFEHAHRHLSAASRTLSIADITAAMTSMLAFYTLVDPALRVLPQNRTYDELTSDITADMDRPLGQRRYLDGTTVHIDTRLDLGGEEDAEDFRRRNDRGAAMRTALESYMKVATFAFAHGYPTVAGEYRGLVDRLSARLGFEDTSEAVGVAMASEFVDTLLREWEAASMEESVPVI